MVLTRTHGIDKDLWYRQQLMVLTTLIVLTKTHGIELVILNNTRTRGPSVTSMQDFFWGEGWIQNLFFFLTTQNNCWPNFVCIERLHDFNGKKSNGRTPSLSLKEVRGLDRLQTGGRCNL